MVLEFLKGKFVKLLEKKGKTWQTVLLGGKIIPRGSEKNVKINLCITKNTFYLQYSMMKYQSHEHGIGKDFSRNRF